MGTTEDEIPAAERKAVEDAGRRKIAYALMYLLRAIQHEQHEQHEQHGTRTPTPRPEDR